MKLKLLLATLILLAASHTATAQTSFFTGQATQAVTIVGSPQPVQGPIPFAGIRVCNLPLTQSAPCLPLATITDANGNTLSNAIGSNFGQFQSDNFGRFTFGCTTGANLRLQYTGASNTPQGDVPITCPGASKLNNIFIVDGITYALSATGLQTAINAAIANGGGIVDARGIGSISITNEIDIGNHAQVPVTLLLPKAATWTVTGIMNGTSCALKLFSQSSIVGVGTSNADMIIHAGTNTNNLDSLFCTEATPIGNGSYVRAENFILFNPNGATLANGAANIQAVFDGSEFRNITAANYGGVSWNIHGLVGGAVTFTNCVANGNHVANSIPIQITGSGQVGGGLASLSFTNLSAGHPGSGKNAIVMTLVGHDNSVRFYNTYSEGNNVDTTTANVSAGSTGGPIEFYGITCNNNGSSTAYCVDLPNPGTGQASFHAYGVTQEFGGSANCINDHYTPKTVACDANGNVSMYVTGNSNMVQMTAGAILDTGLTVGNCVQVTTGGLLTTSSGACGTSSGTLTATGSPASGNLAKWSGATSLTNADLTGDITTSGTSATTMAASISGAKTFSTSLTSPAFITSSATPALTGTLRLASNVDAIEWRNNANSGDVGLSKNTSDFLNFGGAGIQTAIFQTTTANVAASGQWRSASGDTIVWRNNANSGDVTLSKNSGDNLVWPNGLSLGGGSNLATTNQAGTGSIVMSSSPTITTPTIGGTIPSYNSITTAGQGVPLIVAVANQTAQSANVSPTTLYAVPAAQGGMYRISCWIVLTQAATTSSTLPSCTVQATDNDTGSTICGSSCPITQTNTSNTVSTTNSINSGAANNMGVAVVNAKASTNIQYATSGYASSGATAMQFAVHIKLEYLGP